MKIKILIIFIFLNLILIPGGSIHAATPIKILLVPGHDDQVWGAQYGNLKEANMNLSLAIEISNILKKDKRFQVYITRQWGGYTKTFADYFSAHQDDILTFEGNAKKEMQNKIADGSFVEKENTPHNTASEDVALKLYGFNKWADENKIDAMIHIHFNDYPRPDKWTLGKYKGFAIYMPDEQMVNSKGSVPLAKSIFTQLKTQYITSTYEKELGGLIPDQKLIGLGANGTLLSSVRSVLIEYGYIYRFRNTAMRQRDYKLMATLTATGIKNYFFPK